MELQGYNAGYTTQAHYAVLAWLTHAFFKHANTLTSDCNARNILRHVI